MTTFHYKAIPAGAGGGVVAGAADASNEDSLRQRLRDQGLIVIELKSSGGSPALRWPMLRGGLKRKDTVWFFQTLRRLLSAQAPMEQAMSTMLELAPTPAAQTACHTTLESLRNGDSLADAVAKSPGLAKPQHIALLRVGHQSGQMAHCAELIERSITSSERLRRNVTGKLIYPAILVVASIGAVWILTTFVIPKFAESLQAAGAELPMPTKITLAASGWLMWALPPILVAAALAILSKPTQRWPSFGRKVDRLSLRLPVVRDMVKLSQGAVIADILATMLEGGGDLIAGLKQAHNAVTSPAIAHGLATATKAIREGAEPGLALHEQGVLPAEADALVHIGARSGDLVSALQQSSNLCVEKQEETAERLLTLMGPAIILVLASMVGWIVYSLIAGMLSINDISALG